MNIKQQNILINVVLGLVCLITLIFTIFLIWYKFFKVKQAFEEKTPVTRIPNPLYEVHISETTL